MLKLSQGSVKDLYAGDAEEEIHFLFSDRVSVFDYGAIPEQIPNRGETLCRFAKTLFRELSLESAYLGDSPLGIAGLKMQRAAHPKFKLVNQHLEFIPLEVIFRWGVPEGSKLIKRGLKPFETFSSPTVEFTSKLEAFDRDLNEREVIELLPASVSLHQIQSFTLDVATKLKSYFERCGLQLWDGKIELAIDSKGNLKLIDAITPDELRLTLADFPRVPLSKELLRRWYQKTLWPQKLEQLKKERGQEWKNFALPPPALGQWRIRKFSELFSALAQVVEEKNSQALELWMKDEVPPKVFVAGSGGRETALKWKLEQEGCLVSSQLEDADTILVSNDNDLADGRVNQLLEAKRWAIGPTKEASHIEWSKLFGKEIASLAGIPMAAWTPQLNEALQFSSLPVIKQDGLAAGKGVALPETKEELEKIAQEWSSFPLLYEERLQGEEASIFFWIHPHGNDFNVQFLGSAKDFKRRFDGDKGPNTGGMGAQSPHPTLTDSETKVFQQWAHKTALALKEKGVDYSGALFMGLLRDKEKGWCLLEYNARFGDPETQALVLRWKNQTFLRSHLALSLSENLNPELSDEKSLCLALVHPAYPAKGDPIDLPSWNLSQEDTQLFMTGSRAGRMAYLCLKGKENLGEKTQKLMSHSPWKNILEWRRDPLL